MRDALIFRPFPRTIWGADSEICIGQNASSILFEILQQVPMQYAFIQPVIILFKDREAKTNNIFVIGRLHEE